MISVSKAALVSGLFLGVDRRVSEDVSPLVNNNISLSIESGLARLLWMHKVFVIEFQLRNAATV